MGRALFDHADFLAAARALCAERGPAAVTVDAIIERLKAPKGSFYHRFASRDALLGELWLATVLAFQEGFVAAIEAGDGLGAAHLGHLARTSVGDEPDRPLVLAGIVHEPTHRPHIGEAVLRRSCQPAIAHALDCLGRTGKQVAHRGGIGLVFRS